MEAQHSFQHPAAAKLPEIGPTDPFVKVVKALLPHGNPELLFMAQSLTKTQLLCSRDLDALDIRPTSNNRCRTQDTGFGRSSGSKCY
jgi:hypothetical protein